MLKMTKQNWQVEGLPEAIDELLTTDFRKAKNLNEKQIKEALKDFNEKHNSVLSAVDISNTTKAIIKYNQVKDSGKDAVITFVPTYYPVLPPLLIDAYKDNPQPSLPLANCNYQLKKVEWDDRTNPDDDRKKAHHTTFAVHFLPSGETGAETSGIERFKGSDCHIFGSLLKVMIDKDIDTEHFSVVVVEGKNNLDGLTYSFKTGLPKHPLIKTIEQAQTLYSKNSLLYSTKYTLSNKVENLYSDRPTKMYDSRLLKSAKIKESEWLVYDSERIKTSEKGDKFTLWKKLDPSVATLTTIISRDWYLSNKIGAPVWEPSAVTIKKDIKLPGGQVIKSGEIESTKLNQLFLYVQTSYGFTRMTQLAFKTALDTVASQSTYNPRVQWLKKFDGIWDGKPRIATVFHDYLGVQDTPETREASSMLFTNAIIQSLYPGTQQNYCFDLIGGQGIGKTTLLRKLTGSGESEDDKLGGNDWTYTGIKNINHGRNWDDFYANLSKAMIFEDEEMESTNEQKGGMNEAQLKSFITQTSFKRDVKYQAYQPTTKVPYIIVRTSNDNPEGIYTIPYASGGRRFIPLICTLDREEKPTAKTAEPLDDGLNRHSLNYYDVSQFWAEAWHRFHQCRQIKGSDKWADQNGKIINMLSTQSIHFFARIYQDLLRNRSMDRDLIDYIVDQYNESGRLVFTSADLSKEITGTSTRNGKVMDKIMMDARMLKMEYGRWSIYTKKQQDVRDFMDSQNKDEGPTKSATRVRGYKITEETKKVCHVDSDGKIYSPVGGLKGALGILTERHAEFVEEQQKEKSWFKAYSQYQQEQEVEGWKTGKIIKIHAITKMMLDFAAKHDVALVDSTFDFPMIDNGVITDDLPFEVNQPASVKHQA